jgi:hypothetical protein
MRSPELGLKPIRNRVSVVVGFKKWMDVIMSSALLDQLGVETNGVGCVVQSMMRSGMLEIQLIQLIVRIMRKRVCYFLLFFLFLKICFISYFLFLAIEIPL